MQSLYAVRDEQVRLIVCKHPPESNARTGSARGDVNLYFARCKTVDTGQEHSLAFDIKQSRRLDEFCGPEGGHSDKSGG